VALDRLIGRLWHCSKTTDSLVCSNSETVISNNETPIVWIAATLIAAVFQVIRTAMQQRLRGQLTPNGAGFVRYGFGAPLSLAAVAIIALTGHQLPQLSWSFVWRVAIAGIAQIGATNLLIRSFTLRDFAIGTTYSKTEALQVAVLSWAILSEPLRPIDWIGAIAVLAGVVVLACKGDIGSLSSVLKARGDKAMWAGIGAGGGFAVAAIYIRASSGVLGDHPPVIRALFTLATMNVIQTVLNGGWLAARQRGEFVAIAKVWKSSALVGLFSVLGSAGWAIGMTLHNAAVVRTVGQIDLVFAFLAGRFVFHEQRRRSEYVGAAIVVVGVATVLLA
jgi:drug/metabolite transporter (DMT)-like permease